jgi:RNA-directed DNA polymerase
MMNDTQKSNGCTVAMKSANKPDGSGAESMERRRPAKGNAGESCTHRTLSRGSVTQGLDRVRERAKSQKERFTALLHHVDVERPRKAYLALKRNASPGDRWHDMAAIWPSLGSQSFMKYTAC